MGLPPSKRPKRTPGLSKTAIQPARVLNASSPILQRDLHAFLPTALSPTYWAQYSKEEKANIIELLPDPYHKCDTDQEGKLRSPLGMEFLQEDTYVRAAVMRFERDMKDGFWEQGWRQQAQRANEMKLEGRFDDYLRNRLEELFGEEDVQGTDADMDESDSDWARKRQTTAEEEFFIEKLLQDSQDGDTVEVKWKGYQATTWEPRSRLEQDVPDMLGAFDARSVLMTRPEGSGDMVEVDGMPTVAHGQRGVESC